MVNVAHDRDDRRTVHKIFWIIFDLFDHILNVRIGNADNLVAKFLDDKFSGVGINRFVLGNHHTAVHQRLDDFANTFSHTVGQF